MNQNHKAKLESEELKFKTIICLKTPFGAKTFNPLFAPAWLNNARRCVVAFSFAESVSFFETLAQKHKKINLSAQQTTSGQTTH